MDPEAVRTALVPLVVALSACTRKEAPRQEPRPAPGPVVTVPPVAQAPEPVSAFLDAGAGDAPYDQAKAYFASGQVWLARLVLEKKALGSDGERRELELLSAICEKQADRSCLDECTRRLGRQARPPAVRKKGK